MGHGIAQAAATAGMKVVGVEREEAAIEAGRNRIESSVTKILAKQVAKGQITEDFAQMEASRIISNLSYETHVNAVAECDLVIEAIVEDMRIKVPFWKQLGSLCKPSAVFASNTSSLPITGQAEASGRPSQFVGLHFFNPVQVRRAAPSIF
jgi:3-hydroxyacyl-CoA dehydrogenase